VAENIYHIPIKRGLIMTKLETCKELISFIENNELDEVKKMVEMGTDINYIIYKDNYIYTPLYHSVRSRNDDIFHYLIKNGADIYQKVEIDCTLLMSAAAFGTENMINTLLAKGFDINQKAGRYGMTPLMCAVIHSRENTSRFLLQNGADVSIKNNEGVTAFKLVKKTNKARMYPIFMDVLEKLCEEEQKICKSFRMETLFS
jgi:ankyrin repeat protein